MSTKYSIRKKLSLSLLMFANLLLAEDIYTVDQLILKALDLSPDLHISSSKYEVSKNNYDEAFSNYLPKVDLYVSSGVIGASDIPLKPNDIKSGSLTVGQLSIKQIIYDFGKTGGLSDSKKFESDAYLSNYKQSISDKKRDVKNAYYNVLKAKSLILVHIENVKLNTAQVYRSQKYFEAGIRTKIDVTDAKVELIKSQLELNDSEYTLKLAYAGLDNTIGYMNPNREYKVYHEEIDTNNLNLKLVDYPLNLVDSIEYAYTNRYEIQKYSKLITSSKAKQKITSSEYYPQIYLNANYIQQSIDDKLANTTPETQYNAMINLNWNIYQGGASFARDEAQKIQTNISHSELTFSKLGIKTEVTNAYINLNSVKDSVILSKSLLDASKEKFTQAGQRYEHGLSDYIELQQARQGYIDASASLVVNYYNYFDAIAILDNVIGK